MKHFGTDIIRGIDLYQSEGARQFCFPSHTVLSLLRGEMRVRAGEKNFSFAGSGIILIPSGRKTDLFCEQSAVFLLIRISPAFLMEAFTRDRLLTEVISSHELPELLTLVPDLAALVPLFLESAELNRLAVNRLLFTFLERLDHTLANLQSLLYLRRRGARGYLYDNDFVWTVIENETLTVVRTVEWGLLSAFCRFAPLDDEAFFAPFADARDWTFFLAAMIDLDSFGVQFYYMLVCQVGNCINFSDSSQGVDLEKNF